MNNSFNQLKTKFTGAAMAIREGFREATKATRTPEQAKHAKKGSVKARQAGQGPRGRHYMQQERQGPFHRQIGVKHLHNNEGEYVCTKLIMQTFYVLRVLHATKGWRVKTYPVKTSLVDAI